MFRRVTYTFSLTCLFTNCSTPPIPSSPLLSFLISGLFSSSSHQANQRKLVEHIVAGSVKKIEKLLEQGLDPNFVTEDGSELQTPPLVGLFTHSSPSDHDSSPSDHDSSPSNRDSSPSLCTNHTHTITLTLLSDTPLGLVCGRHSHVQCIMPLLSGGAHIDFRGKDGLTPLHRAAIGGNAQAVKVQCPI